MSRSPSTSAAARMLSRSSCPVTSSRAARLDQLREVLVQLAERDHVVHLDVGIGASRRRRPTTSGTAPSRPVVLQASPRSSGWAGERRSRRRTRTRETGSTSSRIPLTISRTLGSSNVTWRRVKPELMSLRSCRCRGGSVKIRLPSWTGLGMRRIGDRDALGRRERQRVAGDEAHVLVLGQRPEVRHVVPHHRCGVAQFPIGRIRIAGVEVR